MLVQAWLDRAASARPDREAVDGLTYARVRARAASGAAALRERGIEDGDRVGIALPAGADFAIALHATWLAGGVAVPVDPRLGDDERAHVTATTKFVLDEPLAGAGEADPGEGRGGRAGRERTHDLQAPAAIVHTSGSTGLPKPVTLTFGNFLWSALGSAVALGLDPEERWLCPLPLSHVGGLSIVVRSAIYGTTARILERWDTDRALEELDTATLVSLVPTTLARLLDAGWRDPPRLRTVLLGGAAIPPALVERARAANVPVTQTYGMTEACSQVATAGVPLFCTRVTIAPDDEILVAGPTVAVEQPLHTGDLGRLDEHGHLHVTGRKADTIITGGENVAPTEVEAVLAEHPAVAEAAVHGRPDAEWGEAIVATVVLRAPATEDELRTHVAGRLAAYKVPKEIAFADALPRTASGKLLRRALG